MGIYYKEWLESRWKFLTGLLVFSALSLLNAILYPWVKTMMTPEMQTLLETMLKNFPLAIPEGAFGPMDWNTYLYSSWISKTLYQCMTIYILIVGAPLLANEESRGTLEFLLAKPISHLKIIAAKYLINLAELILVVIVSTYILYPASLIAKENINLTMFTQGLIQALPGFILLFSLAFLISSFFKDSIKAIAASVVAFFILSIPSFLSDYSHLSIYRFMQGINILKGEAIEINGILIMLLLSVILLGVNIVIFSKKEV